MNPDTGAAETPAHPKALSWRRDLDYRVKRFYEREDAQHEAEERALRQSARERAAENARRKAYGQLGALFDPDRRGGSVDFLPGGQARVNDPGLY